MPISSPWRCLRHLLGPLLLCGLFCFRLPAQSTPISQAPDPQSTGQIYGTVTDSAGNMVVGAQVTLQSGTKESRSLTTDGAGAFDFTDLAPGSYRLSVSSEGFSAWASSEIHLPAGQYLNLPPIPLQVAAASTSVRVTFSSVELAEQQMHVEEKQRVLGVFPNFYTSYVWDAEPLTTGQKFRLALRTSVDPVTFLGSGFIAGVEQWQHDFPGYHYGAEGYAKRFGASYTDGFIGVMLGGAVLPSILHQDPRYFYKGTGSVESRSFYAISTVFITKGDNGRWQPNYSNVLGTFAAAGISNVYYPSSNRGFGLTLENSLLSFASNAAGALVQEFIIRKISRGVPPIDDTQPHQVQW